MLRHVAAHAAAVVLVALSLPAGLAHAAPAPAAPAAIDLDLPELPEPGDVLGSVTADEAKLKTARGLNAPMRILPFALALPLSIAGMSLANTSPIAWGEGDPFAYATLRSVGLSVMGGGLAANLIFNIAARTARLLTGGQWHKDIGFFIGGISAAIAGYALISVGTGGFFLGNDAAVSAILIGGSAAWTIGALLLIIDTVKTALANEPALAGSDYRPGPTFAGAWVAPTHEGPGATGGVAFRW